MILADKYFKETLNRILLHGQKDLNPRPKYKDGVDAHSYFISPIFETYDLSKGEFPIITLRNTAIKMGIKEMLVIYQKQVNNQEGFLENDVNWWQSWMNEQGNLGRAYSHNLESHRPDEEKRTVVKVNRILFDKKDYQIKNNLVNTIEKPIDGNIYFNRYIVIGKSEKTDSKKRKFLTIQFLSTGYITYMRKDLIGKSIGFDKYERKTYNVGYIGEFDNTYFTKKQFNILMKKWEGMFKRCYTEEYSETYNNTFVHNEWHNFSNFLNDIKYIPQFHLAKDEDFKDWDLDKDYYGSNCYSKYTCTFLKRCENIIYRNSQIKPIKITKVTGEIFYELTYTSLAQKLNISTSYLRRLVKKGYYKDLKFSFIDIEENFVYRYELSRNQINELLKGLVENPYGRRHIVSLWNWANMDKKELVECAFQTLFTVKRNENNQYVLDMTLIQRSSDYLVAKTINSCQYVAFQMMIAKHCGYELGKFNHFIQNVHIYDRHLDALEELWTKEPLDVQPMLHLKTNKNFYDYTINDFEIIGTENITKIKSPLELAI